MIIAISGKIGAGKDTVGKIIQYLDWQKFENAPYTSFESWLTTGEYNNSKYKTSNIKIKKFAGKLKEIASILTGIPIEKFEDQEFKKTFLGEEWNYYYSIELPNKILIKENYDKASVNQKTWFSKHEMTVRDLLQKLGTEALRNGLHENVWVNALFADYNDILIKQTQSIYSDKANNPTGILNIPPEYGKPNWLITDLRFPNEFQAVKERNGICVRISRPFEFVDQDAFDAYKKRLHSSETALDNHTFDYELNNSGSIEDLVEEVRKMLITFKII